MKWLYLIIRRFKCKHKWEKVQEIIIWSEDNDTMPIARKHILQCKRCGDMKTHKP